MPLLIHGFPIISIAGIFPDDVAAIVGDEDGGDGEGNDESDYACQTSPNAEREEDDGRREPHDFPHHARSDDGILNHLHYAIDEDDKEHRRPERASRLVNLQQGEDGSREEAYQLTMHYVRKMLEKALISQQEYDAIDTIMRQKYRPIFVTFMEQI